MNKIECYINDNYIEIKKKSNKYHINTDSISNGDIVNKNDFINIIKNNKIFSNIISYKLDIYLNHKISERDNIYYKDVFDELNCNSITINDTSNKLENKTIINCSNYYILYYNNNYYYIIKDLLGCYLNYYKIDELKIISNERIKEIKKIKYYYYNNSDKYFIN